MQSEFWHDRWARNQIGFHLEQVNPYLQQHWSSLGLKAGDKVLVPLCGKTLDLLWLAGQGLQVQGIELSERAVEAFFSEHQLHPQVSRSGAFTVYRCDALELWCGDIFALTAEDVAGCSAFYDRAALIALPAPMRQRYAHHLQSLLAAQCKGLLITLEYDQAEVDGPPFAVLEAEVRALYAGWQVTLEETRDILAESPKFQQAGSRGLQERVYRLER
ncbi:thiopurine S-methyltransferase [Pseudomonas laurentiana]|uniref:Thiopurine S-methyltransferase n=1 Tax=Pseudomonas laurentiana TaxID=2364649 RepID=A0A6I5RUJ4_9PSED|nr:thiopurine S-methyltransferase [Pseudomonas laurentiana]NES11862.1 thiopurine S-methyltransferase [Pseudomonas laurentiana]GGU83900.1 thiopurine S-methyltransferase [Pseudomonas laurentiana]